MLYLVINLDRSPDRLKHIKNQLNKLNLPHPFVRIQGVDGFKLSDEQITTITPSPNLGVSKLEFPRQLTKGEIGCFLSHRKCWQRLVESDNNWAIIMEDDILFSSRAEFYVSSTNWIPRKADLIQLSSILPQQSFKANRQKIFLPNGDALLELIKPTPIGAQAYLISKSSAQKALEMSSVITCPVDDFLFSYRSKFRQITRTYRLNPSICIPSIFESTICAKRSFGKRSLKAKLHPAHLLNKLKFSIKLLSCRKTDTFFK